MVDFAQVKFVEENVRATVKTSFFRAVVEGVLTPHDLEVGDTYSVFWSSDENETPEDIMKAGNSIIDIEDLPELERRRRRVAGPLKGYYNAILLSLSNDEDIERPYKRELSGSNCLPDSMKRVRAPSDKAVQAKLNQETSKARSLKDVKKLGDKASKQTVIESTRRNLNTLFAQVNKKPKPGNSKTSETEDPDYLPLNNQSFSVSRGVNLDPFIKSKSKMTSAERKSSTSSAKAIEEGSAEFGRKNKMTSAERKGSTSSATDIEEGSAEFWRKSSTSSAKAIEEGSAEFGRKNKMTSAERKGSTSSATDIEEGSAEFWRKSSTSSAKAIEEGSAKFRRKNKMTSAERKGSTSLATDIEEGSAEFWRKKFFEERERLDKELNARKKSGTNKEKDRSVNSTSRETEAVVGRSESPSPLFTDDFDFQCFSSNVDNMLKANGSTPKETRNIGSKEQGSSYDVGGPDMNGSDDILDTTAKLTDDEDTSSDDDVVMVPRRVKPPAKGAAGDSAALFAHCTKLWKPEELVVRSPTGMPPPTKKGAAAYPRMTPQKVVQCEDFIRKRVLGENPDATDEEVQLRVSKVGYILGQKISSTRKSFRSKNISWPSAEQIIEKKKKQKEERRRLRRQNRASN